jgi:IclR family KDG regulon transcriptional repressor
MTQAYVAPAVDLASRILALLSRHRMADATLTMISTELGAPKASCLRVLRTLQAHDLLRYDPETRRYALGSFAVVLGSRAEEHIGYLSALRPLLREAARRTGCTAVLVQQAGPDRMMYIAKHEDPSRPHVTVSVGNRFPITDTSYGKWLLAYAPTDVRDRLLARGLRRVTPNTLVDTAKYRAQLSQIRADGVLVSREEYVRGVTAVSCPVFDADDEFLGVLAVLAAIPASDTESMRPIVAVMRHLAPACRLRRIRRRPAFEGTPSRMYLSPGSALNSPGPRALSQPAS